MRENRTGAGLMLAMLIVAMSSGYALAQPENEADLPLPVAHVDVDRYMGQWYEIASIPTFFQRNCTGQTTAEYKLLSSGSISVLNSCNTDDGFIHARGRAKVVDEATNARLKVTFVDLFDRWLYVFGGPYWIIELADDYGWAVVGHPDHDNGWILSRTPALPEETLADIAGRLRTQGYDPCDFITTPQQDGLKTRRPLCELVR